MFVQPTYTYEKKPPVGVMNRRGPRPSIEIMFFALLLIASEDGTVREAAQQLKITEQFAHAALRRYQLRTAKFHKRTREIAERLRAVEAQEDIVFYASVHRYNMPAAAMIS